MVTRIRFLCGSDDNFVGKFTLLQQGLLRFCHEALPSKEGVSLWRALWSGKTSPHSCARFGGVSVSRPTNASLKGVGVLLNFYFKR